MKTGRKYGEKEKIQILIKSLIYRILRIYIFSFYAFLFFVLFANAECDLCLFFESGRLQRVKFCIFRYFVNDGL